MRKIWIRSPLTYTSVVHSTWPSIAMWRTHASTFNKWHKKKKKKNNNKKVTLYILTHGAMRGYELTSLVVCTNDKFCEIRERNVTIKNEIRIANICSLGFQDIREYVTLWRLILWSLGCNSNTLGVHVHMSSMYFFIKVCMFYRPQRKRAAINA